ncbi:HNH endonuclease [Deinococcus sp. S9]|uniref:HNH endonuclease n=1 Tax=Deinococcus sp. S9 TaxID=2545754 RepID=UPI0010563059|nr:HNH endonuclease [Deinococcus sp. S9]TDE84687.1 hypothetical protein E0686_15815 [Deinococcus sp. S9]
MATFHLSSGERIYVDDDILALIEGQTWSRDSKGTVGRSYRKDGRVRRQTLHGLIAEQMGERVPKGYVWTHLDDDWRNFRRENLRLAERGSWLYRDEAELSKWREKGSRVAATRRKPPEKTEEGVRYRGVHKSGRKYKALATVNGKQTYLGLRDTPEEAARLYDQALIAQGLEPVNEPLLRERASAT